MYFRFNKTSKITNYFIAKICIREKMSKRLVNILSFLIMLTRLCLFYQKQTVTSFVTLIGAPIGIAWARISFIFPFSSTAAKKVKTMRKN